ncbi:MAG TPA: hypothetical protein VMU16_01405 [Candidatus Binataceae bacterium]|nr:hypothetical protein [Candidatus Binataceae bacterium]
MKQKLALVLGVCVLTVLSVSESFASPCSTGGIGGSYAVLLQGANSYHTAARPNTSGVPQPVPAAGLGVLDFDPATCAVSGELIYNDGTAVHGPASCSSTYLKEKNSKWGATTKCFDGGHTDVTGTYWIATNGTGTLTFSSASSGTRNPFSFAIGIVGDGTEFHGTSVTTDTEGADPILALTAKKQATWPDSFTSQQLTGESVFSCSGGTMGPGYGGASGIIDVVSIAPNPELIGGVLAYNANDGWVNGTYIGNAGLLVSGILGVQRPVGSTIACSFSQQIDSFASSPNVGHPAINSDGTVSATAVYQPGASNEPVCPFGYFGWAEHNETSTVLWGPRNEHSWTIVTGALGANAGEATICVGGKSLPGALSRHPDTISATATTATPNAFTGAVRVMNTEGRDASITALVVNASATPNPFGKPVIDCTAGRLIVCSAPSKCTMQPQGSLPAILQNGGGACEIRVPCQWNASIEPDSPATGTLGIETDWGRGPQLAPVAIQCN